MTNVESLAVTDTNRKGVREFEARQAGFIVDHVIEMAGQAYDETGSSFEMVNPFNNRRYTDRSGYLQLQNDLRQYRHGGLLVETLSALTNETTGRMKSPLSEVDQASRVMFIKEKLG